MTNDDWLISMD